MRYRAPIAALALMVSISANAGVFKDETDRFTGARSVVWNSLPSKAEDFSFSTVALYSKGSSTPSYYKVQLITWNPGGRFRDCHHTNWLVDGIRDPYLEFQYSSSGAGSSVIERFDKRVDRTNLKRLASAQLIEFQVCGIEGKVPQSDIEGMREVLEATK